mmetsp:Transcript_621/g.1879  ORF Transcript_621/g.1879 Transcript_621/m.1879 type:complete len:277 (+) Transcript_621:243-1073(+)
MKPSESQSSSFQRSRLRSSVMGLFFRSPRSSDGPMFLLDILPLRLFRRFRTSCVFLVISDSPVVELMTRSISVNVIVPVQFESNARYISVASSKTRRTPFRSWKIFGRAAVVRLVLWFFKSVSASSVPSSPEAFETATASVGEVSPGRVASLPASPPVAAGSAVFAGSVGSDASSPETVAASAAAAGSARASACSVGAAVASVAAASPDSSNAALPWRAAEAGSALESPPAVEEGGASEKVLGDWLRSGMRSRRYPSARHVRNSLKSICPSVWTSL